jgi:hypothetical protein
MIKLDTLVLIDFYDHRSMDSKMYNLDQIRESYETIGRYIEDLQIHTGFTDVVYSAYGSNYELGQNCTDYIFKKTQYYCDTNTKRHALYDINEKPELFENKNILIGGTSFYSCVRNQPLGILSLIKSDVKSIWSSPGITGYFAPKGKTPEIVFNELGRETALPYIPAKVQDFRNDESFNWLKVELTDNHCLFKCDFINS